MKEYYLYRHVRQDKNEVFYVGIGTVQTRSGKERTKYARAFCTKRRNSLWNNIVSKTPFTVEIIFASFDLQLVENKEIEFIKMYRRKEDGGSLANLSSGGDSCGRGVTVGSDEIKRRSKFFKEYWEKNVNPRSRKVYHYDLLGNLIDETDSLRKMGQKTNIPYKTIQKRMESFHKGAKMGSIFSFEFLTPQDINLILEKLENYKRVQPNRDSAIFRDIKHFTLDGIYIKSWGKLKDICDFYKCHRSVILNCLHKRSKSSLGFKWSL